MSVNFRPVLVILAAGSSRRFNGIKLLSRVKFHEREYSMLQLAISKLEPLEFPLIVATGEYHQELLANKSSAAEYHYCSQAKLGLGHTINQITQFVEINYDACSHLLFGLADQVAITDTDIQKLVTQSSKHPDKIICCETQSGYSAPAIFPRRFFKHLKLLVGDKGAKQVIVNNLNHTIALPINRASVDIDYQKELQNWNNNNNSVVEAGELA